MCSVKGHPVHSLEPLRKLDRLQVPVILEGKRTDAGQSFGEIILIEFSPCFPGRIQYQRSVSVIQHIVHRIEPTVAFSYGDLQQAGDTGEVAAFGMQLGQGGGEFDSGQISTVEGSVSELLRSLRNGVPAACVFAGRIVKQLFTVGGKQHTVYGFIVLIAFRHVDGLKFRVVVENLCLGNLVAIGVVNVIFQVRQGSRQGDFLQLRTGIESIAADFLQGFGQDHLCHGAILKSPFTDFCDPVWNGDLTASPCIFHQGCSFDLKIVVSACRRHGEAEHAHKQYADDKRKEFTSSLMFHCGTSFLCFLCPSLRPTYI